MLYRVHYCVRNERRMVEVEACSPREAVVKVLHTRGRYEERDAHPTQILSVSPAPTADEVLW